MNSLVKLLAESAAALDNAGLFKEADAVDDMLLSLGAMPPVGTSAALPNARVLIANMKSLLGQLKPSDSGSSVAVKAAATLVDQLDAAVVAAFKNKRGGDTVRLTAQDALNRFLAISNSQNQAANDMFQPVVKPMVDALQSMIRLPDELIWG